MIYLLLCTLLVLVIVSYGLFERDILSPAIIVCSVYLFSTLCAIYNIKTWDIDLHFNTYIIISSGILIFIFISFIASKKYTSYYFKAYKKTNLNKTLVRTINIQSIKVYLAIIFSVVFFIIYVKSVFTLANSFGNSSGVDNLMTNYRMNVSYGEASLPFIVNQMKKLMQCIAYIFLYVFINNVVINEKYKCNIIYIIPTLLYLIATLCSASRIDTINFFIASITIFYIVWIRKYNLKRTISKKYIGIGVIFIIVFLSFFSFIRSFVGRLNESDLLSYITLYAGGSIQLFDLYLQDPIMKASKFTMETFAGVQNNFAKIGFGDSTLFHQEFRSSNGILIGNIYTNLRKYYQDFGFIGVIVFQSLLAVIFNKNYYKLKIIRNNSNFDFTILLYSYFVPAIFMSSIQELFFSSYFSLNSLVIIFIMWLCYNFFVKYTIKFR